MRGELRSGYAAGQVENETACGRTYYAVNASAPARIIILVISNLPRLFTDADNTLWETDGVFAEAQLTMLQEIQDALALSDVPEKNHGLDFLRQIDQRIAASHPDHLRYPPGLLAEGLARAIQGEDSSAAADAVATQDTHDPRFNAIVNSFVERLDKVPPLRVGVRETFDAISVIGVPITVVTEGASARVAEVLKAHQLDRYVERVISARKTVEFFEDIRRDEGLRRCLMVGDQLDRDIAFSQRAGFETFYFAGAFRPYWHDDSIVTPNHEITRYDQIIPFLQP